MKTFQIARILNTLIVSLILFSCSSGNQNKTESENMEVLAEDIVELRQDQIDMAAIETGTVELRSLSNTLNVNGNVAVAPQNLATVCMPMGGFIKQTNLVPGIFVKKGQPLAQIENQEFLASR